MEVPQLTKTKWKLLFWIRTFISFPIKFGWGVESEEAMEWKSPGLCPTDPFNWFSTCRFPLSALSLWAQINSPPPQDSLLYDIFLCPSPKWTLFCKVTGEKMCSTFTSSWNFLAYKTFHKCVWVVAMLWKAFYFPWHIHNALSFPLFLPHFLAILIELSGIPFRYRNDNKRKRKDGASHF